jgi:hypothetical protein
VVVVLHRLWAEWEVVNVTSGNGEGQELWKERGTARYYVERRASDGLRACSTGLFERLLSDEVAVDAVKGDK